MTDYDFKLFKGFCQLKEKELFRVIDNYLIKQEYEPSWGKNFLIAEGDIPILLIAHLDTVHKKKPREIYYDKENEVIWSPQGLGADDRAGVFAIIKILQSGLRPHILFTTGEETGGFGAFEVSNVYQDQPFIDLKYMIELDRQGWDDCVFYDCYNKEFIDYVESFGFTLQPGLFTDISIIAPSWKVAAVNLSIGYIDEHTICERLFVKEMYKNIDKVKNMLKDANNISMFKYVEGNSNARNIHWLQRCAVCQKLEDLPKLTLAQTKEKDRITYKYLCKDCATNVTKICYKCKTPFIYKNKKQTTCYSCSKEGK